MYTVSIQNRFHYLIGYGDSLKGVQFEKNVFFNKAYDMNFSQLLRLAKKCKAKDFNLVRNTIDYSSKYMIRW